MAKAKTLAASNEPVTVTKNEVTNYNTGSERTANVSDATIAPNLRADLMRKQMESKNTLQNEDSLYIGTGNIDPNTGVYETKEFKKPTNGGGILQVDGNGKLAYEKNFSYDENSGVLTITWWE